MIIYLNKNIWSNRFYNVFFGNIFPYKDISQETLCVFFDFVVGRR